MNIKEDLKKWANPFREGVPINMSIVWSMVTNSSDYWSIVMLKFRPTRTYGQKPEEVYSALWNIVDNMELEGYGIYSELSYSDRCKWALMLVMREMEITGKTISTVLERHTVVSNYKKANNVSIDRTQEIIHVLGLNWRAFGSIIDSDSFAIMNDNIIKIIRRNQ